MSACGLEFNFWQQATTSAGETLDLLLLVVAIWLLLEHRLHNHPRWLAIAALVWGLGMAENWVMQVTLPLFVIGILWQQGLAFFDRKFVRQMALWGLAGFSIYALLPLINSCLPAAQWSLGEAWINSLKQTKQTVGTLFSWFFSARKDMGALVLFYFLMPILPCLIRVPDEGGYHGTLVARLQILLYHLTHGLLLAGCLWLALDPQIGPRQIILKQFGVAMPLLTFDYLTALGAGYFTGYFLLIYGSDLRRLAQNSRFQRPPFVPDWTKTVIPPALIGLLVALLAILLLKNYSAIAQFNRQPLIRFGELAVRSLPPGGGIILSDDPLRLAVVSAALSATERQRWQTVDTTQLISAKYRTQLEKKSPRGWIESTNQLDLRPTETVQLLDRLAGSQRIFYLHPSFGYFFEVFYQQPLGSLYELKHFDKSQERDINPPPLDLPAVSAMEKFWDDTFENTIQPLTVIFAKHQLDWTDHLFRKLKTSRPRDNQSRLLGEWYSVALDDWGVQLQRLNSLPLARKRFEQAAAAATNNLAAKFNLNGNSNLQAGVTMDLSGVQTLAAQFRNLKQMNQILTRFGPIDDPVFCYLLGTAYTQSGLLRQAIREFERARTLAPEAPASGFALAQLYAQCRLDSQVFATIREIRKTTKNTPLAEAAEVELAVLEARSWLSQTNFGVAKNVLESALEKHPGDERVLELLMQAYLAFGDYTNALQVVSSQANTSTNSLPALMNKSVILLMMNQPSNAIPVLNQVLSLTNNPKMRINRAAAYLKTGNIGAAEADYRLLADFSEGKFQVNFGLAQIARERGETNLAIQHLQVCLSNSVADSAMWKEAESVLNQLKPNRSGK